MYSRIVLSVLALSLAVNFALTDRSWKLASAPRVSELGVLDEMPALAPIRQATEGSEAALPYPPRATPPDLSGRKPLKVGLAYREVSLFGMPLYAYPEPGLIAFIERPGDMQALVLDPDQAALLDAATGLGFSEVRFHWWAHLWGWLLLVLLIVWTKARSMDIRNSEARALQGEPAQPESRSA